MAKNAYLHLPTKEYMVTAVTEVSNKSNKNKDIHLTISDQIYERIDQNQSYL